MCNTATFQWWVCRLFWPESFCQRLKEWKELTKAPALKPPAVHILQKLQYHSLHSLFDTSVLVQGAVCTHLFEMAWKQTNDAIIQSSWLCGKQILCGVTAFMTLSFILWPSAFRYVVCLSSTVTYRMKAESMYERQLPVTRSWTHPFPWDVSQ